ncbi:MAG: ABC transporter permease [Cyanobacteria bacterium REEB65]|nr:ABC transporter permease [Cyanobacteria bacterium REEB65]
MPFLLFLAQRYLRRRWRQTAILVASVAVGVAILTTALSLTNGFSTDLVNRILGTTPHITALDALSGKLDNYGVIRSELAKYPHVRAVLPFVSGQALVAIGTDATGAIIRGVDPALQAGNVEWGHDIVSGSLEREDGLPGVLLGTELARKLGVTIGDRVRLLSGVGESQPVVVSGLYRAGIFDYDAHIAFVDLATAQRMFKMGDAVSGLEVRLDDVFAAPRLAADMARDVPVYLRPWTTSNHSLLAALAFEMEVIFLVVVFIIVVATLGVANTLAMWVLEQSRDLGLLRAVGASGKTIGRLVLFQGLLVGILGTGLGLLVGWLLSLGLAAYPIHLPQDVYYIDRLPVQMQLGDFLTVAACAVCISLLACILPSRRAIVLDPIEILRRT